MGALSPWHLAILLCAVILLFGPSKLPDVARGVGRGLRILKTEMNQLQQEVATASAPPATTTPASPSAPPAPGPDQRTDLT